MLKSKVCGLHGIESVEMISSVDLQEIGTIPVDVHGVIKCQILIRNHV